MDYTFYFFFCQSGRLNATLQSRNSKFYLCHNLSELLILKMIFSIKLWYFSKSCVISFQFSSAREVMFLLLRTVVQFNMYSWNVLSNCHTHFFSYWLCQRMIAKKYVKAWNQSASSEFFTSTQVKTVFSIWFPL